MTVRIRGDHRQDKWVRQPAGFVSSLNDLKDVVTSDASRHLLTAYESIMASTADGLPSRDAFDPMSLGKYLANTVLYDVSDRNHVVFRIVGETMKSHFRSNPVGRCYLEFVPDERRQRALSAFRHCAEIPCGMLSRTRQVFTSGVSRYCEAIGVPLMGPASNGFATHLLFVDSPASIGKPNTSDDSPFRFAQMLERRFVDLGFGVPETFEDLVLSGEPNPFKDGARPG